MLDVNAVLSASDPAWRLDLLRPAAENGAGPTLDPNQSEGMAVWDAWKLVAAVTLRTSDDDDSSIYAQFSY
jgi:hypothetical protein